MEPADYMPHAPKSVFGTMLRPGIEVVPNAILTKPVFDSGAKTYVGAVYSNSGAIVPSSLRPGAFAYDRPIDPVSIDRHVEADHLPRAIYGGHFFYAWGHFLIETLSTAASEADLPDCPVVYLPWTIAYESAWADSYFQHALPVVQAAWRNRPIIVTRKAVRFDTLYIPQRLTSFGMRPMINPAISAVFERVRDALAIQEGWGNRLLVTRQPNHRRALANEAEIVKEITRAGFHPISPEHMSAADQVCAMSHAKVVVGMRGSALHNAAFSPAGTKVIEIGDVVESPEANIAQLELAGICGHSFHFVHAFGGNASLRSSREIADEVVSAASIT